jgi:hypothetical protein
MRGGWLVVVAATTACNAVAGLDDLSFGGTAAGGALQTSTSATSSNPSASTAASMGGSGGSPGVGGGSSYVAEVLADQPLGYWRLGEAQGALMAVDASGNGRDGSFVGSVELGAPGAIAGDTAARFDGVSRVTIGDHFDFASSFTVEAWSNQNVSTQIGYQGVCAKLDVILGEGYVLYTTDPFHAKFTVWSGDMPGHAALGNPIPMGSFTHLVGVYDGTNVHIFINGIELAVAPSPGPVADTDAVFEIGFSPEGNEFEGVIDEVAVYGTALSAERIEAHYNAATR